MTTAINVVVIENIDLWIVIEYRPLMMRFLKKKKLKMNICIFHEFPATDIIITCV